MIAPASEGGAIHANSCQSTRPRRAWVEAEVTAAAPLTATLAPAPAAGELANSTITGSLRFPSTSPTSPPVSDTKKAHAATTIRPSASKAGGILTRDGTTVRHRRRGRATADRSAAVGGAAGGADAPADARRAGRPGASAASRLAASHRDRNRRAALGRALRPAGLGQDHLGTDHRLGRARGVRGGVGGERRARRGPGGHLARRRAAPGREPAHDLLP